jgi:hypothetical protein
MVCQQNPLITLSTIIAIIVPVSINHIVRPLRKTTENTEPILNIDAIISTINSDILTTELMYVYTIIMITIIFYKTISS